MRRMGGLAKAIPWTYGSMLAATLAIAGTPGFSGFFSKDAILLAARDGAYANPFLYWLGVLTAGITSFYMFRLLFMTFAGDYRGATVDAHGQATHAHGNAEHGHGEPHESPWVMLGPLVVLALLSTVGGLVGVGNRFEHFLGPVFGSEFPERIAQGSGANEILLMALSVLFALAGAVIAYILYVSKPYLPDRIAESLGGLYRAVFNKYYDDEFYAKVFVNPLVNGSTRILWQGIDRKVIDDTVNDAADGARHVSDEVRHMQSGNIRSYAGWISAGAAILIAYMVWQGVGR